jgi:hypothetical protein
MSRLPLPVIELTSRPVGPDVVHASRNAERIGFGGATLDVFIDSDPFELGRTALLDWITGSANAVTAYFGRFRRIHLRLRPIAADAHRETATRVHGFVPRSAPFIEV